MSILYNYLDSVEKPKLSKIYKIIQKNKSSLTWVDPEGFNAIMLYLETSIKPNIAIVQILAIPGTLEQLTKNQDTVLHIYFNFSEEINYEITNTLCIPEIINIKNKYGLNPLMFYCQEDNPDPKIIKLLANPISVNDMSLDQETALNIYIDYHSYCESNIIRLLLNQVNFDLSCTKSPIYYYIDSTYPIEINPDVIALITNSQLLNHIQESENKYIFPLILYLKNCSLCNSEPQLKILNLLITAKNLTFKNYDNMLPINYYMLKFQNKNQAIINLLCL